MVLYSYASGLLHGCFLLTFLIALLILAQLWRKPAPAADGPATEDTLLPFSGSLNTLTAGVILLAGLLTVASIILLYAFINHDFVVEYVASYSDRTLPIFYRITAFWAGQPGSLLFWAWSVALSGACFVLLPAYKRLTPRTKLWYCFFYFCIMAFFLLLMAVWSNPFVTLDFFPRDGRGLNPLLQNPGMIFHPPLLFLGYGGFVVPGCLALAQTLSGRLHDPEHGRRIEEHWGQASRPFILIAWSLLTAGIVLGAWWAYMELGWGGYWAWDPVENASLIPWLTASAYLHTAVIGSRRGKLQRTNVFLIALTTISAFFATYLVRSGVVQSLHAFGDGGVGTPLLVFTLAFLYIAAAIVMCEPGPEQKKPPKALGLTLQGLALLGFCALALVYYLDIPRPAFLLPAFVVILLVLPFVYRSANVQAKPLEDLTSREGLLLLVAWLLLAISFIILVATMWPVIIDALRDIAPYLPQSISAKLPEKPMGLEPAFYNRTCLPLFALFAVLLLFCPWRRWKILAGKGGFSNLPFFGATLGTAVASCALLWFLGIRNPVAMIAAASALASMVGIILYFAANPGFMSVRTTLAAHGVHIGILMMTLGVAFSGPYQQQYTLELNRRQEGRAGNYFIVLNELYEGESQIGPDGRPNFRFLEAELMVKDADGKVLGKLSPQRRLYTNFESQVYAEVDTMFSLGNELYATLLGVSDGNRATLAVNVNPLVNWLWIGGTIMCLLPFLGLSRVRREEEDVIGA